jgi:subtilase family serine protease
VDAFPIPAWQKLAGVITSKNKGSKTIRNSPDVSAEANLDFYSCADQSPCQTGWGGTSFAAPMWAGYMALVNQQAVKNGKPLLGFINPLIYPLGLSKGYAAAFHDITKGSNGFPAVKGYDLATGWGSPNGAGLINALAP